ncbi:MAG TPA: TonB-dependent receptor [Leadbetterella sp.]|nr:TonB-dependent receptor [Leadbetterella sp.]
MNKLKTLLITLFASTQILLAQNTVGKVSDKSGEPLIGASIVEKGTNNGTITDTEGKFSIKVSNPATIFQVSYIGFKSKELKGSELSGEIVLEQGNLLDQVVIVGSRSMNRSATDTPAPIDVIDIKDITSKTGQLDLNQLLQFAAPSFNSNRQSGSDGTDHVDPASLRGLGPDQTLVLINGKRRHQSSLVNIYGTRGRGNTGTDLNTIPAAAIERIEILRDGAAAQYGSDAIAGVINIVLKKTTETLEINANSGIYKASYRFDDKKFDGLNYNLNTNYGLKIGKDGFINFTGDFNFRDHTNRANAAAEELARREFGDPKAQNTAIYINASVPINSTTAVYAFGGSNNRKGESYAWTRFADDDRNIASIYPDGFDPLIKADIVDNSIAAGVRTKLKGWEMDLSNTFGSNKFEYSLENTLNTSLGATSPTAFEAGGFSLNQNTINLGFSKFLKDKLSGLNLAYGAEYRVENYQIFAGEEKSYKSYIAGVPGGSQGFPGFQPSDEIKASRSNFGLYFDTEADFTKKFMVGAALRFENYSDFGNTLNGKISTRLKINDVITFRGTASTGFRAPSLPQINFNSTVTNFINGQPVEVLIARNNSEVTKALGIPSLKQELSKNASLGFTVRPNNTFSLTVDGYWVQIKDRIVLTGQFTDEDEQIGQLLKNINVAKAQFFTNAVNTTTTGLDIILSNKDKVGEGFLTTSLAMNFNKLNIDKINTNDKLAGKEDTYFDLREQYFLRASAPPSKINLTFDYQIKKFSTLVRLVRFGQIELADWNYDVAENDIYKPKTTTDLSVNYKISKKLSLSLGSNNIFNVYPDISSGYYTESGGAWDPVQMGSNGAFYYGKLNIKL